MTMAMVYTGEDSDDQDGHGICWRMLTMRMVVVYDGEVLATRMAMFSFVFMRSASNRFFQRARGSQAEALPCCEGPTGSLLERRAPLRKPREATGGGSHSTEEKAVPAGA